MILTKNEILIGIETSCDETSVSLMINGKIIDEITTSSMIEQCAYGGVVPEVATRYHQSNIHKIFKSLLEKNNVSINEITHVIYTANPGLPGCLHVGSCFAKTLSNLTGAKLVPINHLYGHLFSPYINNDIEPIFPLLGLVISGGHTIIYLAKSYSDIEILNTTQDDAVGEVYDKVARALGMGYPGGPKIDKIFNVSKANINFLKNNFPVDKQFSFSGIKTSVLNYINIAKQKSKNLDVEAISSSFQKIIIDEVIRKINYYAKLNSVETISIGGGVAANNYLRSEIKKIGCKNINISELKYTGDQASMIV